MKTCIIFLIIIIIIIGLILTYLFLSKKTQQKVVRFDMTKIPFINSQPRSVIMELFYLTLMAPFLQIPENLIVIVCSYV